MIFKIGDRVKIREDSKYFKQAYASGGNGTGKIINIDESNDDGFIFIIKWDSGIVNSYRYCDVIIPSRNGKKIKNPQIDPFEEENWGYIQEGKFHGFEVGDKVRIRNTSHYYIQAYDMSDHGYKNVGDGTGEVVELKNTGMPLRVLWKNGHVNSYNYEDLELFSDSGKKKLKKPELDPFEEENWGYVQESIYLIDDYEIGDRVRCVRGSRYEHQAYGFDGNDNGIGIIVDIIYNENEELPFSISWDNGHTNRYGEKDIEPLKKGTLNKKRKKLKKPEIDPFEEENWGYIQENSIYSLDELRNFYIPFYTKTEMINIAKFLNSIGEKVFKYDMVIIGLGFGNSQHKVYSYNRNNKIWYRATIDEVISSVPKKMPLNYNDLKIKNSNKIKKIEIDPFGEEFWGYEK